MNRALSAAAVAFVLLLGPSCGSDDKNPAKPAPAPTPTYPVPSSPESALVKLCRSYGKRDSIAYKACFALDYQGASYDTSEAQGYRPATFTRLGEEHHIRHLAEAPTITSVILDLGAPASWVRTTITGDMGESWAWISIHNPFVEVIDGDDRLENPAGEVFDFSFRPTTPAPDSPTDTLWHIVRWAEAP